MLFHNAVCNNALVVLLQFVIFRTLPYRVIQTHLNASLFLRRVVIIVVVGPWILSQSVVDFIREPYCNRWRDATATHTAV